MIVRTSKGSGISGAVRYVMGEGKLDPETGKPPELALGETSRVAWYGGTGFGFAIDSDERLDIARRVMEWAAVTQASKTKRCKEDCFHLMLAWDQGEQPTRPEMEAAAHSVLAHLGMGNARAIWACHDDTEHPHLHIVASRIDPETGKAFRDSFDKARLSEWALQFERDHGGVRCEARVEKEERQAERDPEKVINAFAARRETFAQRDLMRELSKAIPSRDTRRQYVAQLLQRPDIVPLADPETGRVTRYTTRQTLAAEQLAEASGERLHADTSHRVSGKALHGVLQALEAEGKQLRADQMQALEHATGAEGLAVIAGKAGTGKSFTLKSIQDAYEADGYVVTSLAPTNKVASALKRDGLHAGTIHGALGGLDRAQTEWNARTVVMVDEAGMVSTRLMARLLSHAEHAGAKVILVGDEKQLASIERGGLFGYLAAEHGSAELAEITRQRTAEQRELATRASRYDFAQALGLLQGSGRLIAAGTEADRIAAAAEVWRERTAEAPDGTPARSLFVVAVSNKDAEAANEAIRQIRRERGELGPDHVLATTDGPKAFATGDRILFSGSAASRKDREAGLANGNAGTVTAIAGSRLTVALDGAKPGQTLSFVVGKDREAGEFDAIRHGYAGTIYKAQGATYDEAIVIDSRALKASSAYVALSRHRDRVTVVSAPDLQKGSGQEAEGPRAGGADVAAMATRWQRADERRAALHWQIHGLALTDAPPENRRLTPAQVRAAVGVEKFEEGALPSEPIARAEARFAHTDEPHHEAASPGQGREREADAAAGDTGSGGTGSTSTSGSGGGTSSGSSGKTPWTAWPAQAAGQSAIERHRLEMLRREAEQHPPVTPAAATAPAGRGASASAGRTTSSTGRTGREQAAQNVTASAAASAWRMPRLPKRPKTVQEERANLAAFARSVAAHLHDHHEQEKEHPASGGAWWQRLTAEAHDLWHSMRDFVHDRLHPSAQGPAPPTLPRGPDMER